MAASGTTIVTNGNSKMTENESLPELFGRLGEDAMRLVSSQLALFKVEIKEEADVYARGASMMAVGAAIGAIGFALANVAVAFGVSTLFANADISQPAKYALGFLITGIFYIVIGAIVLVAMKNRLAKQRLMPARTVEDLRKDKEWLKKEL
jgi:MFS family permease